MSGLKVKIKKTTVTDTYSGMKTEDDVTEKHVKEGFKSKLNNEKELDITVKFGGSRRREKEAEVALAKEGGDKITSAKGDVEINKKVVQAPAPVTTTEIEVEVEQSSADSSGGSEIKIDSSKLLKDLKDIDPSLSNMTEPTSAVEQVQKETQSTPQTSAAGSSSSSSVGVIVGVVVAVVVIIVAGVVYQKKKKAKVSPTTPADGDRFLVLEPSPTKAQNSAWMDDQEV